MDNQNSVCSVLESTWYSLSQG